MSEILPPIEPRPIQLTKELAMQHAEELAQLADQIPGVHYGAEDILAERKGDRVLHAKWEHSLVMLESSAPIALVMSYEREAEGNDQYPKNTLYVSELAVAEHQQGKGLARNLLRAFFEKNNSVGFTALEGNLNYTIQTNSAEWNRHVIDLYRSFGFTERARKDYPDRTDVVLGATATELQLQ